MANASRRGLGCYCHGLAVRHPFRLVMGTLVSVHSLFHVQCSDVVPAPGLWLQRFGPSRLAHMVLPLVLHPTG